MNTCHHCGANLLHDDSACTFCGQPVTLQLSPEVRRFIRLHAHARTLLGCGPMFTTLRDARVIRQLNPTMYEWTRLGRMLAQDLAA